MRATTLLAGAALAMVIATAREGRCAGIARRSGAVVVSFAAAGSRTAGPLPTFRDAKAALGLTRLAETSPVAQAVLAMPQFALGIARPGSGLQLTLEPTYEKVGRSRHAGLALSGRF